MDGARLLLLVAGAGGVARRRLETRFGLDFAGGTAVGFSLLLPAMGVIAAWLILRVLASGG